LPQTSPVSDQECLLAAVRHPLDLMEQARLRSVIFFRVREKVKPSTGNVQEARQPSAIFLSMLILSMGVSVQAAGEAILDSGGAECVMDQIMDLKLLDRNVS